MELVIFSIDERSQKKTFEAKESLIISKPDEKCILLVAYVGLSNKSGEE